jgi:hypothetical protein
MVSDEGAGARPVTAGALDELHDLGVTFTVDGFAAGRSLLASAAELPVAAIRLTGAVVGDLDSRPRAGRFVRGIVELGRTLEVPVSSTASSGPRSAPRCWRSRGLRPGAALLAALTGAEVAERLASEAANACTASTSPLRAAGSPSSTRVTRVGSDDAGASATRPSSTPDRSARSRRCRAPAAPRP